MDDFQQPLFAFEAFCGGGFVHLALKEAGITVAMANDFCPKKAEIYKANFPRYAVRPTQHRRLACIRHPARSSVAELFALHRPQCERPSCGL